MQAYSMDLRVRVMADVDAGVGTKATADKYRVSPDWVRKLKRFRRQTGSYAARQQRVSHVTKLDEHLPRLRKRSVRPVLTRALVWGRSFSPQTMERDDGTSVGKRGGARRKWRDRMSRWRRSGRLSIAEFCAPGADIAALSSSAGESGWWETVLSRIVSGTGSLRARPEPEAAGSSSLPAPAWPTTSGIQIFIARRGDRHAATLQAVLPSCVTTANSCGDVRRHGGRSPVLNVPTPVRVFLYTPPARTMRKSFSGLHGLIVESLKQRLRYSRATGSCS